MGKGLGWIAALILSGPAIALAQQIAIGGYAVPSANSQPQGIAAGPDGALWFAESGDNKIGRITTAGIISEYPVTTANSAPVGITAGPDGALWFTDPGANQIGRITTSGVFTAYAIPTPASAPQGITAGSDGALWFTELLGNNVGRITTAGVVTEYPVLTAGSQPVWIAAGPDGALWFTEQHGNNIGRITTAGVITEYPVPTATSDLGGITAGPDGALWFAEQAGNNIGRITAAGVITEFPLHNLGSEPDAIIAGPDGALWFTEFLDQIGRITTAGVITGYVLPPTGANAFPEPKAITVGADGELWFTESNGGSLFDSVGEAVFANAGLSVSPATGFYRDELTFMGSSFAPNETVQIYLRGVGSTVIATARADASGSFTVSAHQSQSPYGPRIFLGVGQTSGKLGAASFSVTPRLILNPTSGTTGSIVMAQGYGFGAGEPVQIYWDSVRMFLTSATADVNGTFKAVTFTVPKGAPAGRHRVFASGKATGAEVSVAFTVQ